MATCIIMDLVFYDHFHNIIKYMCSFMWTLGILPLERPKLVQGDSNQICICTRSEHPMVIFSRPHMNKHTLLNNFMSSSECIREIK
jgi:hypothetical protein